MAIIYNVTIEAMAPEAGKESRFRIKWHHPESNSEDSFEQSVAGSDRERMERLWQRPGYQLDIGQTLFSFLDGDSRHLQRALVEADRQGEPLELHLQTCGPVADWPLELLAREGIFLLPRRLHLVRQVSEWGAASDSRPEDHPLTLLFMACSALDIKPELDFEREEEAIFHITEKLPIDMEVEDSGSLEGLKRQLAVTSYDVVHLSGHADIDKNGTPYFIMEDKAGYPCRISPGELWDEALIDNPPRLLFLSGCHTAEPPGSGAAVSFARLLAETHHIPAVLGWGRSVSDNQAILAEEMLYYDLSRGKSIPDAVQRARYELTQKYPSDPNPAWPLLRLFSTGKPLKALVTAGQPRRPKPRRMVHGYLRQSRVRVLTSGFIGRRRQLQQSINALEQRSDKIGILILGSGGLGKSCLAGKISERFAKHTLVIVHGTLDALTLEAALTEAFIVSRDETGQHILSQKTGTTKKLANLSTTSFLEKNYLILLDDFEQNLEGAEKGEPGPLLLEAAELLKTLLHWLPFSGNMTQLILTCRYDFTLTEQSKDLVAERLEKVWLHGFRESERRKKTGELKNILNYPDPLLVPRLLNAGCGNPLLMEELDRLAGRMKEAAAAELLAAFENRREEFIRQHLLRKLLEHGGEDLTHFLQWLSIFRRPVQIEGIRQVAEMGGLENWEELLPRGMGLSLLEYHQAHHTYQLTPLLREELLNTLKEQKACHQAAFAYYKKMAETQTSFDPVMTEEWVYHALGYGDEKTASRQGARLLKYLREHLDYSNSRRVGQWILAGKKQDLADGNDAFLLNELATTLKYLGEYHEAVTYYEKALALDRKVYGNLHLHVARDLNNLGSTWRALGEPGKTLDYCRQALHILRTGSIENEHPHLTAIVLENLGTAWGGKGDFDRVTDYFQQALVILRTLHGDFDPDVATALNNLGSALKNKGDSREAAGYFNQALTIDRTAYGSTHPDVATDLNNLGSAAYDLGEYANARDYYEEALILWRKIYPQGHRNIGITLFNLGEAYLALKQKAKARACFQEAHTILKKALGPEHPAVKTVAESLANAGSEESLP